MHGKLGAAPLTVVHTFFSSLEPESEPSEKLKKSFFNYSISKEHLHMVTCNFLSMHLESFLENPDFSVFLFIKIRNENVLDQYIGSARKDIKHKCIS